MYREERRIKLGGKYEFGILLLGFEGETATFDARGNAERRDAERERERERERELGRGQEDAIIALHRPTDRRERRGEGGRDAEMDGFGMRVAAQRPQKEQSDTRLSTSLPPSGKMENGAKEGRQGENKRKRKKYRVEQKKWR